MLKKHKRFIVACICIFAPLYFLGYLLLPYTANANMFYYLFTTFLAFFPLLFGYTFYEICLRNSNNTIFIKIMEYSFIIFLLFGCLFTILSSDHGYVYYMLGFPLSSFAFGGLLAIGKDVKSKNSATECNA